MKKKLLGFMIAVIGIVTLAVGNIIIKAGTKEKEIDKYLSASFDVYNVPIVDSYLEFEELISNGQIKPAIEDKSTQILYSFKAKKNGCIVISASTPYYSLYDVTTKNTQTIKDKHGSASSLIPMRKGEKFAIVNSRDGESTFYIGFIPEESIYHIDESVKNPNGTLKFTFGNVYGNDTVLMVSASKKNYLSRQILTDDIMLKSYQTTSLYEYSSISEANGDAILSFPEAGEYTLTIRLKMNDRTIAITTMILDTDDYINPSLEILDKPVAAIAGTNLMVGFGEPSATVYLSYDGKKYSGVCDRDGIYRIIIKEDMKKGVKFKIWQSKNKLESKKASYRVTGE